MKRFIIRCLIGAAFVFGAIVVVIAVKVGPIIYRSTVGLHRYESVAPVLPSQLKNTAILVFSKTNGFRHDEAIDAANRALSEIADARGWSVFLTDNGAVFNPDQLRRFKTIVWNNTSGDVLTEEQRVAFKAYIQSGGGFVGIHAAGGDPKYAWNWYVDDLVGAQFIGHTLGPQFQQATIRIEDSNTPATRDLGARWDRTDEWYSFQSNPRQKGFHILANLDENSYSPLMKFPVMKALDLHMRDHPIIWSHCVGNGLAVYSALGHLPTAYSESKYLKFLEGALAWTARLEGSKCVDGVETAQ
jgi:type 1 glutamine amidotransferase